MKIFSKKKKENDSLNNENAEYKIICDSILKIKPDISFEIKPDTGLQDIGFNSMDYINLMLSFEEIINKDIDYIVERIDLKTLVTVNDAVLKLQELLAENK